MTALPHSFDHQVAAAARRCAEAIESVSDAPLWSLGSGEAGETLLVLTRARAQLDELLMRVLRHGETVETGMETGAVSTTSWWYHETRTTRAEAHRTRRLAEGLERHACVQEALAAGEVLTDQARVIVDAVDALPDDVAEWVPPAATEFLLARARDHDAKALRVLGRRLLEVIDPEAADAEEARRLEAEEREARAAAALTMSDDGHGRCHGRFTLPTLHAEMLRKHLVALASPARAGTAAPTQPGERGLSRHRMGRAFMDYIESRPADSVPSAGGVPATVVVTMELSTLLGGLKAASLDTGARIALVRPAGSPARPASSRSCWAGGASSSTSGASAVSTPRRNASQWVCATVAAPPSAVMRRPDCVTPTTTSPGPRAAGRVSSRGGCSARSTTRASTTRCSSTHSTSTGRCSSVGGREAFAALRRSSTRSE